MHNDTKPETTARQIPLSHAALWASAFVLGALTIVQAGAGRGAAASAQTVSNVGDLTAMTSRSTVDEDIFCILDGRAESLLVYRIDNQNKIELQQTIKLADAFAEARAGGGTGTRPRR